MDEQFYLECSREPVWLRVYAVCKWIVTTALLTWLSPFLVLGALLGVGSLTLYDSVEDVRRNVVSLATSDALAWQSNAASWSRLTLICYAVVLAIRVLKVPFIARHLLDWIERLLSSIQNIWLRLDERSVRLVHLACAGLVAAGGIALLWTLAPEMRGTPPPKHSPGAPLALELPDTPSPEAVIAFPDGSIRGGSATVEAMPGDRYTLTFRPAGRQLRPK